MTKQGIVLTAVVVVFVVGGGLAAGTAASQGDAPPPTRGGQLCPAEMHQGMGDHMSDEARAQCEQAHARMGQLMDNAQMRGHTDDADHMGSGMGRMMPMGRGGTGR